MQEKIAVWRGTMSEEEARQVRWSVLVTFKREAYCLPFLGPKITMGEKAGRRVRNSLYGTSKVRRSTGGKG